ncbi:hypothetical protein K435DRAFT_653372 [Dendrothele bispora CBS 962.96]|uniref:Protein FAM72 n=1 Tax=Dendrothele bispora (strain CBS 962.96) TaxID=1314807 RepID=A0A4S8MIN3_DENBC|nr:hypothetical protein K435DRAFT_653372 [Dendrothele bispora CBS 962.96]
MAHNVWILDCKSCDSFLTNRAMKAVLLLRPNVPLYSSDALPVNCSAYSSNPDVLKPPVSCRPPLYPSRTCECLTQTLCCHGCGATIGYMIVIPCVRCTSSISSTNRATNGHRFVFHSTEVVASKRYYIPDEPGVIPFESVPVAMSPSDLAHIPLRDPYPYIPQAEYLPTPPIDMTDMSPLSSSSPSPIAGSFPSFVSHQSTRSDTLFTPPGLRPPNFIPPPSIRHRSPSDSDRSLNSSPPPLVSSFSYGMPAEQFDHSCLKLKAGDPLYWHHLTKHGEIPGVSDDPRSRQPGPPTKRSRTSIANH